MGSCFYYTFFYVGNSGGAQLKEVSVLAWPKLGELFSKTELSKSKHLYYVLENEQNYPCWALHKVAVNTFLPSSGYLASHQLLFANSSFLVFLLIRSENSNKPHRPPSMLFISERK